MSVCSRGLTLVVALAACDQGERSPPASSVAIAPGFNDLPAFPKPWSTTIAYDCSITGAFGSFLPDMQVEPCGLLELHADESERAVAVDCMKRAEASRRAYLVAEQFSGIDSEMAGAHLVTYEAGVRVMYEARFDSDPCGGSCGAHGGTVVRRCRVAPDAADALASTWLESKCKDGEVVESCAFGESAGLPRALAEGMSAAVLGDSPATLAAAFGPIRIGAPRSVWALPDVRRFVSMIESAGLVSVGGDRRNDPGERIEALVVRFAGPCSRVRAVLQETWGPPTAGWWVNRALHQRAQLDLNPCRLRVERIPGDSSTFRRVATTPRRSHGARSARPRHLTSD